MELLKAGKSVSEVAADLGLSSQTICSWRCQEQIDSVLRLVEYLLQKLGQHAGPGTDAQDRQPFLAERLPHTRAGSTGSPAISWRPASGKPVSEQVALAAGPAVGFAKAALSA